MIKKAEQGAMEWIQEFMICLQPKTLRLYNDNLNPRRNYYSVIY